MKTCARFDYGNVKGEAIVSEEGYIRANAIVTRTGIFVYQNFDGSIRKELRHPDDVWDKDSIKSMEMIPVTNGHPREKMVTVDNFKQLAIGYTGQTIEKDGDYVMSNFVITDKQGVDAVVKFGRKELSLGYMVDLDETPGIYNGEHYDAKQTNIRYNHLAIVDKARAGKEARIALDSFDAVEILNGDLKMTKKIKIDEDEYLVEENVASHIAKLEEDLKNLQDERDRVENEIKMIRDKLEETLVDRDNLKETVTENDKKMDAQSFQKAVKERVELESHAKQFLSANTKLDSMTNEQIKKEVIKSVRKTVNVDGKSEVYIDGMFDSIIHDKSAKKVNVDNVTFDKKDVNDGVNLLIKAQSSMMSYMKNLNKPSLKDVK